MTLVRPDVPGIDAVQDAELVEYERRLGEAREREESIDTVLKDGRRVVWRPQEGSQTDTLSCPLFEVLTHGTRGGGKTDGLVNGFAAHVGKGYGPAWRGILFRQTYPQLADVQAKTEKWFRRIFPTAKFNRGRMQWEFATGETLLLRHMARPDDYWNYHGHEYPWIGWEELTNWATDECYRLMFSCCRSADGRVPRMVRATTNPYGVGHNWVKERFRLAGRWWETIVITDSIDEDGNREPPRCAIYSSIDENEALLRADPNYKQTMAAAASNKGQRMAWVLGSWDFPAGGMFDDVWSPRHNVVPEFDVPTSWTIDRSFDWGSSKPFSVGWWARSDGTDLRLRNGRVFSTIRGDLFRVREWYGWNKRANEGLKMLAVDVAKGIVEREIMWGWRTQRGSRVQVGVADSAIHAVENGMSIAQDMEKPVRIGGAVYPGIAWLSADKRPGSRKSGWEMMRKMIANARPKEIGLPREAPGLYVVGAQCEQFLRTVISLPRDPKDLDDIDTDAEDHIADEVRYRVRMVGTEARQVGTSGTH